MSVKWNQPTSVSVTLFFLGETTPAVQSCLNGKSCLAQNWTMEWLVAFCHLALPLLQGAMHADPLSGGFWMVGPNPQA
eukprot:7551502-Prorocentrum_lima.AAC.1